MLSSAGTDVSRPAYTGVPSVVLEPISTARLRRRGAASHERRERGHCRQPAEHCQREQRVCLSDRQALEALIAADPYFTTPGVTVTQIRDWHPFLQ